MINLIAGFFCSFFLHAFLFSFFFNINFNDYSEEKIIQLPVSLIFEEKIEPKPKKSSSKNVKTTSSSFSEDAKSKNDFESDVNSFFSNLEKDRDRVEQISTQSEVLKIAAKIRAHSRFSSVKFPLCKHWLIVETSFFLTASFKISIVNVISMLF